MALFVFILFKKLLRQINGKHISKVFFKLTAREGAYEHNTNHISYLIPIL